MLYDILVKRLHIIPVQKGKPVDLKKKITFLSEMAKLGYKITNVSEFNDSALDNYDELIKNLLEMKGGNVKHVPLFKGFPEDVPEKDEFFIKRIIGFLGNVFEAIPIEEGTQLDNGLIVPDWLFDLEQFGADPITGRQDLGLYQEGVKDQDSRKQDSHTQWFNLKFVDEAEAEELAKKYLARNLYAKSSIKEALKPTIEFLLNEFGTNPIDPTQVVFKETKTYLMKFFWDKKDHASAIELAGTPTDLLRLFASVTDTDVSLAEPIKFPKFTRAQRRLILGSLDKCKNLAENLNDYKGLWLKVGKALHPGDYSKVFKNTFDAFTLLRNGKVVTFNSKVEQSLSVGDVGSILGLLTERPGIFARRIHHILEVSDNPLATLEAFAKVVDKVQLKNLLVLEAFFSTIEDADFRTVINKKGKIRVMDNKKGRLGTKTQKQLLIVIKEAIVRKIGAEKESWDGKNVWVDPALATLTVPLQQRKASDGLMTLGRGSKLPIDDGKVLRLFVYWKENLQRTDLDLSLIAYDKDMKYTGHVSYTNLSLGKMVHSGDITSAPHGAAEFIDIPLEDMKATDGTRYIATQIYRYAGDKFSDMPECFSGWMIREKTSKSQKSFDIKTVQNKFDMNGSGAYAIPILVDLETKEIIFIDLYVNGLHTHNRVEGAYEDISSITREVAKFSETRPNLMSLAAYHAEGRNAELVQDKDDADITFGVHGCDYNAGDVEVILSELL